MSSDQERRATNVSLPVVLVREARDLGVNLSRAAEIGVSSAIRAERQRRWKADHQEAFVSMNEWVEQHGLPLAPFREF